MDEEAFQLVRGLVFASVLGLGLLLERVARHARLAPAWRTNVGLWASNAILVGLMGLVLLLKPEGLFGTKKEGGK